MKSIQLILAILFLSMGAVCQQDIDSLIVNRPNRLVNDHAKILKPAERDLLEAKLVEFDNRTSTQLAVLVVPTLHGRDINETATKVFNSWGIGTAEKNNGVLILVASKDRQVRISLGYGMENAIPDDTAAAIIQRDIVPAFKKKKYFEGLNKAAESIMEKALIWYPERKIEPRKDSVISN